MNASAFSVSSMTTRSGSVGFFPGTYLTTNAGQVRISGFEAHSKSGDDNGARRGHVGWVDPWPAGRERVFSPEANVPHSVQVVLRASGVHSVKITTPWPRASVSPSAPPRNRGREDEEAVKRDPASLEATRREIRFELILSTAGVD